MRPRRRWWPPKENSDLPIFVTLVLDEKGRLLTGGDIPSAVTLLEGLRVDALGLNCGLGPDQMAELLPPCGPIPACPSSST